MYVVLIFFIVFSLFVYNFVTKYVAKLQIFKTIQNKIIRFFDIKTINRNDNDINLDVDISVNDNVKVNVHIKTQMSILTLNLIL